MTDRFGAQLRQHLVDTANERPAEGQLAAIFEGVAATSQRTPLVARLTWLPGRVGPIPSTVLRLGLVALALLLVASAAAIIAGGPSGRSTVFEGTWVSIDPTDQSNQTLVIGPGAKPTVHFEDDVATGGACDFDSSKVFKADGTGRISTRLDVLFPQGGGCLSTLVPMEGIYFVHRADDDTLLDQDVVSWHRSEQAPALPVATPRPADPSAPPSEEPSTAPSIPPSEEPLPTLAETDPPIVAATFDPANCVDVAKGTEFTGQVEELLLTATIPEDASVRWQGSRSRFELASECAFSPPITIHAATTSGTTEGPCLASSGPDVTSFDDAVATLDAVAGGGVSLRIDKTIGGYEAARYDISSLSACSSFGLWGGTLLGRGESGSFYLIDVGGTLVSIELNTTGGATPVRAQEARAIVESLQFGP